MGALTLLIFGFLLGIRHATDTDHIVAVTTLVTQQKKLSFSAFIGAIWGMGHTLTLFGLGTVIILLNLSIPEYVQNLMEFAVGVMILYLGISGFLNFYQTIKGNAKGRHGANEGGERGHVHLGHKKKSHHAFYKRSFLVGLVHGLAGSASAVLLVLSTIQNPYLAIIYLFIFGLGTIIGMLVTTFCIGLPYVLSSKFGSLHTYVGIVTAVLSVFYGSYYMYSSLM